MGGCLPGFVLGFVTVGVGGGMEGKIPGGFAWFWHGKDGCGMVDMGLRLGIPLPCLPSSVCRLVSIDMTGYPAFLEDAIPTPLPRLEPIFEPGHTCFSHPCFDAFYFCGLSIFGGSRAGGLAWAFLDERLYDSFFYFLLVLLF